MSLFKKIFSSDKKETLDKGLEKSKTSFFTKLSKAVVGKSRVDDEVLDEQPARDGMQRVMNVLMKIGPKDQY